MVKLEDSIMADDLPRTEEADAELAELREAAVVFARRLGAWGKHRAQDWGIDLDEAPQEVLQEGQRLARDVKSRLARVEAKVEQNIREHPATWAGGLLGAIGFGLMLGMLLRRKD